jgi:hypothetical protein
MGSTWEATVQYLERIFILSLFATEGYPKLAFHGAGSIIIPVPGRLVFAFSVFSFLCSYYTESAMFCE